MTETDRGPVTGVVAFVTLHVGYKVAGRLAGRGAAVVTVGAGTGRAVVVKTGW